MKKKKILCEKYCDGTIELIMIAFPTIRAETFLFAQLRDEVGVNQSFMASFLWNASLGYTGQAQGFPPSVKQSSLMDVHQRAFILIIVLLSAVECSRGPRYKNTVSLKIRERFHL